MSRALPPYPSDGSWQSWATKVYEWLVSRDQSRQEVLPQTVLLESQTDKELARATADGMMMFDPIIGLPVFSRRDNWVPISTVTGAGVQFNYRWDNSNSGDPGDGRFAIDDPIDNPTNTIRVSDLTDQDNDVSIFWATATEGDIILFIEDTGSAESGIWVVTAPAVDQGTYWEIPVEWANNTDEPENNRKGIVSFVASPRSRLPIGGSTDEALLKASDTNYDVKWRPVVAPGYGGIRLSTPTAFPDLGADWQTLIADAGTLSAPYGVTQDFANNAIIFERPGVWNVSITASITHDEVNNSRQTSARIYNTITGGATGALILGVGRNTSATNIAATVLAEIPEAAVGQPFVTQLGGGDVFSAVTLTGYAFNASCVSEWRELP